MTTSKANALAGVRPRISVYKRLCMKVEEMIDATRGGQVVEGCKGSPLPIIIELRKHEMLVVYRVMLKYILHGWSCKKVPHRFGGYALQLT